MKVIDLLNRIANGEEVPLIKYRGKILHWNKEKDRFEDKDGMNTLYEMDFSELNEEIEIIEEDNKIEELDTKDLFTCDDYQNIRLNFGLTWSKINTIIDKMKSMEEKINAIVGEEEINK